MKTIPYPESAKQVKLSNDRHPFTPAHDVRVIIDAFSKVPEGNILDIGCNLGWTTREFALAFPKRLIYAVDWPPAGKTMSEKQRGEAPNWDKSCEMARDLPNVMYIAADSQKLRPWWFANVTCVFVDGDHGAEGVAADTTLAMSMVTTHSHKHCIAWHDCYDGCPEWVGVKRHLEDRLPTRAVQVADSWVALLEG